MEDQFSPIYGCYLSQDEKVKLGTLSIDEQIKYIENRSNNLEKIYKAVAIISHGNADGTCEIGRDEKEEYFDKLEDAVKFVNNHGSMKTTVWDQTSGRIFEYAIVRLKELERKTRPIEVVTKTETYWEQQQSFCYKK